MPQIGPAEILVILLVALLVFGPKRLPEVGRQVGRGMRELRKLQETVTGEINEVLHGVENADGLDVDHVDSNRRDVSQAEIGPTAVLEADSTPASNGDASDVPPPSLPSGETKPASRSTPTVGRAPSRFRPPRRGTTA